MRSPRAKRRWVQDVSTVSTAAPPGTFALPAREMARIMARPAVSPKGLASAIRMIQYFINRGGTTLTPGRRRELERAKRILQRQRSGARPAALRASASGHRRRRSTVR